MAIKIECTSCGSKFSGKEEFAGRRIRCPKCQAVFRVPGEKVAAAAARDRVEPPAPPPAGPQKPPPKYKQEELDEWNVPEDFEYTFSDEEDPSAARCVYCGADMRPGDVLCMQCGYNRKLGQKITTKTGDDAFADEESSRSTTGIVIGGLEIPWVAFWIGTGVAGATGLTLFLVAPMLLALLLIGLGSLTALIGHFWVIIVAFKEDVTQGLLVWFLPIYWWVYAFTRDEAWLPFLVTLAGAGMVFCGTLLGCSGGADDPAVRLWPSSHC